MENQHEILDNYMSELQDKVGDDYMEFFYLNHFFSPILKKFKMNKLGLDIDFIYCLVQHGFFPMYSGQILPKTHHKRCVIDMSVLDFNPRDKNLKKRIFYRKNKKPAKRILKNKEQSVEYYLSINNGPDIINFTRSQQYSFWISKNYQQFIEQNTEIYSSEKQFGFVYVGLIEKQNDQEKIISTEIGYYYGNIYTSMSGSYSKNYRGFGNLLMYAWGYYLKSLGFKQWDMGMRISYKISMGGKMIERQKFRKMVYESKNIKDFQGFKPSVVKLEEIKEFWEKIEFVKIIHQEFLNEKHKIKMSKRLTPSEKKIEHQPLSSWNNQFWKGWLSTKFDVKQELQLSYIPYKDQQKVIPGLSKKKTKRIRKALDRLDSKIIKQQIYKNLFIELFIVIFFEINRYIRKFTIMIG